MAAASGGHINQVTHVAQGGHVTSHGAPAGLQVVQVLEDCALVGEDGTQHVLLQAPHDDGSTDYDLDSQDGVEDNRIARKPHSKKPLLTLSVREKTAICRYKAQHPDCNQRQIAEHFTKLWNKEICRRRVSDILIQKEKWFEVERRVKGDADKTFRDGKFSNLEKLVYEWIVDVVRSGGRVWDDDVRRSAKRLAEMHDVKSFVASQGWLTGFRKRYGLKQNDEQGDIMIEIDVDSHQSSQNQHHQQQHHASPIEYGHRDENQIQLLQGNEGQSYTVNITVDSSGNASQTHSPQVGVSHHPHIVGAVSVGNSGAQLNPVNPHVGRGGVQGPQNHHDGQLSDIETGDSADEDHEANIGLAQPSQTQLPVNVSSVGTEASNIALDDIVKTIIYGGPSTTAQVISGAAQQNTATEQYFQDTNTTGTSGAPGTAITSSPKSRLVARATMTAVLVRKVLVATKRKLDAETEMIREQKQRHFYEAKMFDERRKRLAEERELIAAQRRKLDAETRFLQEQQRNEVIRRELLLADVSAIKGNGFGSASGTIGSMSLRQGRVHSQQPIPIQISGTTSATTTSGTNIHHLTGEHKANTSYVTVVTGSTE